MTSQRAAPRRSPTRPGTCTPPSCGPGGPAEQEAASSLSRDILPNTSHRLLLPQHSAHGAGGQGKRREDKRQKCLLKPGQYAQKIHSVGNMMVWVSKVNP